MSELLPAAKAVLDAVDALYEEDIPHDYCIMAAALRAAADQMSSHHSKSFLYSLADGLKLKAIAAELEAQ